MTHFYTNETFDPRNSLGGLLSRVRTEFAAALDKELAFLDITAAQYVVLMSLAVGQADSASGLCKGISYDPGAMTRMLDRLESRGLIRRIPHPNDRRALNLALTEEGLAVWPQLRASAMAVSNRFLHGFSEKEVKQLEGFLKRMLTNG